MGIWDYFSRCDLRSDTDIECKDLEWLAVSALSTSVSAPPPPNIYIWHKSHKEPIPWSSLHTIIVIIWRPHGVWICSDWLQKVVTSVLSPSASTDPTSVVLHGLILTQMFVETVCIPSCLILYTCTEVIGTSQFNNFNRWVNTFDNIE